jgi:hypothetical protein
MAMPCKRDGCGKTCKTYSMSQVLGKSRINGCGENCTGTVFESDNGQTLQGEHKLKTTTCSLTYPMIRTWRGTTQDSDSDLEVMAAEIPWEDEKSVR